MTIGHPHQWFGAISYAQHGDDMAVLNVFKRLQVERGTYLDIGAFRPFELSNTALLHAHGWNGICVEANPDLIGDLIRARPNDVILNFAVMGGKLPVDRTITLYRNGNSGINSTFRDNVFSVKDSIGVAATDIVTIVNTNLGGMWPDFVSVDAEGRDLDILRDIPPFSSSVILVEARSQFNDITIEIRRWASERGYFVHSWCGFNMLLVREDFRAKVL